MRKPAPRRLLELLFALVLYALPQAAHASPPTLYYGSVPGIYNVMDYGARCDGTTDDTTPIANAEAAADGVGAVGLPLGKTCITNARVTITSNTGFIGVGTGGLYATLKAGSSFPTNARALLSAGPNASSDYSWAAQGNNIWIDRVKFDCSNMTGTAAYANECVWMSTVNHVKITNSYVYNGPQYGIFVGNAGYAGNDYMQNISDVRILNTVMDSNGRLSISGHHADQIGGGYVNDELYDGILCISTPGTCTDNVFVQNGKWVHYTSNQGGAQTGQLWCDVGCSYMDIEHFYINGGSIHMFGNLGSNLLYPHHITIAHGFILNGNGSIEIGGGNSTPASANPTYENTVEDVKIENDLASCFTGSDMEYSAVYGVQCKNWDLNNAGKAAFYTNSIAGVNSAHGNLFFGNTFDAGSNVGTSPFLAYQEGTAGYTGQNTFVGNTCAQHPVQQCAALYDESASTLTVAHSNNNFNSTGQHGTFLASAGSFSSTLQTQGSYVEPTFNESGSVVANNPGWHLEQIKVTGVTVSGSCGNTLLCPTSPATVSLTGASQFTTDASCWGSGESANGPWIITETGNVVTIKFGNLQGGTLAGGTSLGTLHIWCKGY